MKLNYFVTLLLIAFNLGFSTNGTEILPPSATITGGGSVCVNAPNIQITFTGSGGTAPYTFVYQKDGGPNLTISSTGANSTVTVPVVTTVAGTFIYTLVSVQGSTGAAEPETGSTTVIVSAPPILDFTFSENSACSGTSILFNSSVSGTGAVTYSWDFGDGTALSTAANPTHIFNSLGCGNATFNVVLTIIKNGCTVVRTKPIIVKQRPDISFVDVSSLFDPFNNCSNASSNPVYSITVGNSSASTCVSSYTINWGDGNTETNITFPKSHTYNQLGAYSMIITALGSNGCSNSKTYPIKNVSNPLGGLNSPGTTQNLCAPTANLQFSISNWGTNSLDTTYSVDYGDGTTLFLTQGTLNASSFYNSTNPGLSTNYPIPHIYTTSNCPTPSFEVRLFVTNVCGTTPLTVGNITVLIKPVANFTNPPKACAGSSVTFTNTSNAGFGLNCNSNSVFKWNFGDGSPLVTTAPGPTQNITHTYAASGNYNVTLEVTGYCGSTTITKPICIEPPLTPLFTINTNAGCAPLAVTATNTTIATNQCEPPTYLWEVSYTPGFCGTSAPAIANQTTTNASFNFTEAGTYTISLKTTNSCGTNTSIKTVEVKKPPVISINPIANSCVNSLINPTAVIPTCATTLSTVTYAWSFPGGSPATATTANPGSISYATAGTYTISLVVTNNCGASNTATQTVVINPTPTVTNTVLAQSICSGAATTPIVLTATPAGTTFSWSAIATAGISGFSPSGTTSTIPPQTITTSNASAGTVTYTITPTIGSCLGTPVNYVITVNPAPTISTQPLPSTICLNGTAAPLSIVVNSSVGVPTYQWYSNLTNSNTGGNLISGATSASYVPPTDVVGDVYYYCVISLPSGGCSSLTSAVVLVKIVALPTILTQPVATQNICVGITISNPLSVIATGGTGTVSYQWFSNTSNATTGGTAISGATASTYMPPVFTTAGTFYYYATIAYAGNNCGNITSQIAIVIVFADPTTTQPIVTQNLCQGATPATLEVMAMGGNGTFSYQWFSNSLNNTTSGTALLGATNSTYIPLTTAVGTTYYYCVITQSTLGCAVTSATATVIVNQSPSVNLQPTVTTSCVGDNPTTLTILISNGLGTPTYQWFSNVLNSNSGGNLIANQTTNSFTPSTAIAGTLYYYVTVTFPALSGGCEVISSNTAMITVNPFAVIASESDTICSGNTFSIIPTDGNGNTIPAGTTYTWSLPIVNPAGSLTGFSAQTVPQTQISQTLTNPTSSPATITYTVTPTSGVCVGTIFTVLINVNPAISANVTVTNNTCFGVNSASISTLISGGILPYNISWIGPNSFSSNAASISNLEPGTYTITIDDAGNCPFTNSYSITQPDDILITTTSQTNSTCFQSNDGTIDLSITGGTGNYIYSWTKDTFPFASTQDLSDLAPGIYTVTVTDANNCGPKIATYTITEPPLLVVSLLNQTNINCFGAATGVINITVVGGTAAANYNFAWTGPNGFTSSSQNLTSIIAGTYNLVVTDDNGCQKTLSVTLTQSTEIIISYTSTQITCYGANDGSFSTTISGGNAPYTFTWNNLSTVLNQNNLSAGDYIITVTDNLGCIKTATITIAEVPIFTVNPVVQNVTCFGANNGSINLNLVGGIAPVTLTWNDGSTAGLTRNNLSPGTYTATITDGKPCVIVRTFIIVQPQPLIVSANLTNPINCTNANSGIIDLVVSGGTPSYTYSWSNGAITEDLNTLVAGSYAVTVTDAQGCTTTGQYSLIRPVPITISVATQTDFDCALHQVTQNFVAQASGGIPPYQYQWSSGNTSGNNNQIMQTDTNGTVILTVQDNAGCTETYTVNVDNPEIGYASFEATSLGYTSYGIYSILDPIQFTSIITGDYESIYWDFGDGTFSTDLNPTHVYLIEKEYVVNQTVTYPFGCSYTYTIILSVEKGYLLVVPTAFTPNNDSLNDTYRPVTKRLKNIALEIYDTWGSIIYSEKGDVLIGWDGKIKGFNAENGNYYSKVSAETFYGEIVNENQTFVLIK